MMSQFVRILITLLLALPLSATATVTAPTDSFASEDPSTSEDPTNPGIDMAKFEKALTTTGVTGWVHGRLGELAVFVYRENDFFHYAQFPMISHIPGVASALTTLKRHDKIFIKGKFIQNGAPLKHIYVTELTVKNVWTGGGGDALPPYEHEAKVPDELLKVTSFIGRVHFAAQDGSLIVCEYKDAILPIIGIPGKTNGLFRGDKVKVHFTIADAPNRPTHLELDDKLDQPVEVLQHLVDIHGKEATLTGTLVKFPKSPEISLDVFALQQEDADHVNLTYTLVNFEDQDVFQAILTKLAKAWASHPETIVNGRNKLHNPHLKVTAHGTLNVVSPSQANPQILLKSADDLQIAFE